jgi:hypothetical protein
MRVPDGAQPAIELHAVRVAAGASGSAKAITFENDASATY